MKIRSLLLGATLGVVAFTTGTLAAMNFTDVPANHWASGAVEYVSNAGLMKGDAGKSTFRPDANLTRAEEAVILQRQDQQWEKKLASLQEQLNVLKSGSEKTVSNTATPVTSAVFTSKNGVDFSYPSSWVVSSQAGLSANSGMLPYLEEVFNGKVVDLERVLLDYTKKPENAEQVDMSVLDVILENSPGNNTLYLQTLSDDWDDLGTISSYSSPKGLKYGIWKGNGPVYEGKYMVYVTQYTDQQSRRHWVEISAMGNALSDIEAHLKPVVDSLTVKGAQVQSLSYQNKEHGFSLEFPEAWKGYSAVKKGPEIEFGFPEQNSLFTVGTYSKAEWTSLQSQQGAKPTYLGENTTSVFGYSISQYTANSDMEKRMSEISAIIKTFKSTL